MNFGLLSDLNFFLKYQKKFSVQGVLISDNLHHSNSIVKQKRERGGRKNKQTN